MKTIGDKEIYRGFAGLSEFATKYNIPTSELVECMGEYLGALGLSENQISEQRIAEGQELWSQGVFPGDESMNRLHSEYNGAVQLVRGVQNALRFSSHLATESSTPAVESASMDSIVLPFPKQASAA